MYILNRRKAKKEILVKSLGYFTAEDLDRSAQENHLTTAHRARSFNKCEAAWRKRA